MTNINFLRLLDRSVGVPACVLLRAIRFPRKGGAKPLRRILVIKFWGMGSIVLAYDFFQRIRAQYPSARMVALTLAQNRFAFTMSGLFDEIVALDIKHLWRVPFNCVKLLARLRKERFDLLFDLEFTARFSALWAGVLRVRQSAGFTYPGIWRGDFFTHPVPFDEKSHIKNNFLDLARPFVGVDQPLALKLPLSIDTADAQIVVHPLIGVNVNASALCLLRRWPASSFVSLVQQLRDEYSARIIFIGAQEERGYVQRVIDQIPDKGALYNFAGMVSFTQLACLMRSFDLFISNDSGPLHLAVEKGVPTVSFFGPETPLLYGPVGKQHLVFYSSCECSPCIRIKNYKRSVCARNQACLRAITPEEVMRALARAKTFR
jgi:ADP-heptose:LPS heptosyltransferase